MLKTLLSEHTHTQFALISVKCLSKWEPIDVNFIQQACPFGNVNEN